jgi:hypothetical protein
MATKDQYTNNLLPLLKAGFPDVLDRAIDDEAFSIDDLAGKLGGILEELERQHMGAVRTLQALQASQTPKPWDGDGELAFLLYYLHYPPLDLRQEIDADPLLKFVWDTLEQVAPASPFDPRSFAALTSFLQAGATVKCNEWGDIYGTDTYEQLDPRWAWTLKNDLLNHLPKFLGKGYGVAGFVKHDWSKPIELAANKDGNVRIAVIGDWGAGKYKMKGLQNPDGPAYEVMDTLNSLSPPDYIIHLGDTYYAGTGPNRTPRDEEIHNLVDVWESYPKLSQEGRCFTLNSNHEMYGGAYGYYGSALPRPMFCKQHGCSYFALEFGDWIIAGIDSAYYDPSALYMQGGLGGKKEDPQYDFLKRIKATGKKVILMSHHTGLSTDGSGPSKYLWNDVTRILQPDYWYWGHVHLGVVYSENAYSKKTKARCIGHSSIPFAIPPGMKKHQSNVSWYSDTPLESTTNRRALYHDSPRAKNGFAMITLCENSISEEIFNMGCQTPIWRT